LIELGLHNSESDIVRACARSRQADWKNRVSSNAFANVSMRCCPQVSTQAFDVAARL